MLHYIQMEKIRRKCFLNIRNFIVDYTQEVKVIKEFYPKKKKKKGLKSMMGFCVANLIKKFLC